MSPDAFPGFSTSVSPCKPRSVGYLEIRSADWRVPPSIHPDYLSDEDDLHKLVEGAHYLRKLAATPSLSPVIAEEIKPGPACYTGADLAADIRARAYSVFHPVGTCRMGPELDSNVVDSRLRVHGIKGLRVIDASIFPTLTSGNTNAPSIMVGEHAAKFVLADALA